jgi:hypothetical protein
MNRYGTHYCGALLVLDDDLGLVCVDCGIVDDQEATGERPELSLSPSYDYGATND